MFNPGTVIVLGAAASHSFGFPLGDKFRELISNLADIREDEFGNPQNPKNNFSEIINVIGQLSPGYTRNQIFSTLREITKGIFFASSVDTFLHMRRDHPLMSPISKILIARIILDHETKCPSLILQKAFRSDGRLHVPRSWHQRFVDICFDGVEKKDINQALNRFTVIDFNYDRSFEQFMRLAVMMIYGTTPDEAIKLTASLKVMHPYGAIGRLPDASGGFFVEFGEERTLIAEIVRGLQTFSEAGAGDGSLHCIRNSVAAADLLVFLGFGYHYQNIELLTPLETRKRKTIIGTAVQIAPAAQRNIEDRLRVSFATTKDGRTRSKNRHAFVSVEDKTCEKLLEEYQHLLRDNSARSRGIPSTESSTIV